jgi:hypothetical protein
MKRKILREAVQLNMKHRRHRRWQRIVSGLAAMVVFITTYAMILPAITMENNTVCGLEEHVHTDACFYTPAQTMGKDLQCTWPVHAHEEACYDPEENLICGRAEFAVHTHDDFCLDAEGNLLCQMQERKEHQHTEACYGTYTIYGCNLQEGDGAHTHEDACYTQLMLCEPETAEPAQTTEPVETTAPAEETAGDNAEADMALLPVPAEESEEKPEIIIALESLEKLETLENLLDGVEAPLPTATALPVTESAAPAVTELPETESDAAKSGEKLYAEADRRIVFCLKEPEEILKDYRLEVYVFGEQIYYVQVLGEEERIECLAPCTVEEFDKFLDTLSEQERAALLLLPSPDVSMIPAPESSPAHSPEQSAESK